MEQHQEQYKKKIRNTETSVSFTKKENKKVLTRHFRTLHANKPIEPLVTLNCKYVQFITKKYFLIFFFTNTNTHTQRIQ